MDGSFLRRYFEAFDFIEGAFMFDAALLFMTYNSIIAEVGIAGDVLEIGVHQGKSAIAVAALRGPNKKFVAVDLFDDLQSENISSSGLGNRARFERNLRSIYDDIEFVQVATGNSTRISPQSLGSGFSFCHIDGGHSSHETHADLSTVYSLLMDGGIVALDDYFNPAFPGVCEGAIRFMLHQPNALIPLAIGYNKVLFQKSPSPISVNARFLEKFPAISSSQATMMERQVNVFWRSMKASFDIENSQPHNLRSLHSDEFDCEFLVPAQNVSAKADDVIRIGVEIQNRSGSPVGDGSGSFGLSYHLRSKEGAMLSFDNQRTYLNNAIPGRGSEQVDLYVRTPKATGSYLIEIDLVWENVTWFKEKGNPSRTLELTVNE